MTSVRSVYVHAPFCARRCFYCDFAVTVSQDPDPGTWLGALEKEVRLVQDEGSFFLDRELETLFVGGGTPSLLGPGAMSGLAGILGKGRLRAPDLEWTVEANPDSFTTELARDWARAGVNRVSLGVQSFQPAPLGWLNRLHGAEAAVEAVKRARATGISNLSIDLMFGLPREVDRAWRKDLEAALSLEVPHVSLYGLSIEGGTPLARAMEDGSVTRPVDEDYRAQYLEASELLSSEGYRHYEVSNFSLPGFEARHNQAYWQHRPYLGLGNSSHSYGALLRRWNIREWHTYQESVSRGRPPWDAQEELSVDDFRLEKIWLGLRTDRGMNLADLSDAGQALVSEWVTRGQAGLADGIVRLTPLGWLMLDDLVVDLDLAQG